MNKTFNRFGSALPLFLYSTEDSGGGGGGGISETPEQRQDRINREVQTKLDELRAKSGGNDTEALTTLIKRLNSVENAKNTAENTVNQLRGQVPDEATRTRWGEYEALGTLDEIRTKIGRAQRADELEREQSQTRAARILKLNPDNPLFQTLLGQVDFEFAGEGDAQKVSVKTESGLKPFEEYAQARGDLLAALPLLAGQMGGTNGTGHIKQPSGQQQPSAPPTMEELKRRKLAGGSGTGYTPL